MRIYLFQIIAYVFLLYIQVLGNINNWTFSSNNNTTKSEADSIAPDTTGMSNFNSVELSIKMAPGWNLGNSLEAIGGETAWGNPIVTQQLIDSIKAAGFNAVRIPVAWSRFSDESNFLIEESLLKRVEEVVNYVLSNEMFAIINEHWDNGWMQPTYEDQEYVNNRLAIMWKQISTYFRDYDYHLLFAGTNEVMVDGDYGTPKEEYYTVQNSYNQTFINAVRSTGGRNCYRYLVVQGFNTNIDHTINFFELPTDVVESRLMVEVHYYDPYNFTLNSNSNITQWGKNATNSNKTETWANEAYADNQFDKMKTTFVDKGYAVILGEYGVISRLHLGSEELNDEFAEFRRYYIEYIASSIFRHKLIPFYWDNGYTGNYGLGIFNRTTGEKVYTKIIQAIMNACDTNLVKVRLNDNSNLKDKILLKQNYPNPFNPVTTISYFIPVYGNVDIDIYNVGGDKIKTLVSSIKSPGNYSVIWDGKNNADKTVSSGVYFYNISFNDKNNIWQNSKKMIFIK